MFLSSSTTEYEKNNPTDPTKSPSLHFSPSRAVRFYSKKSRNEHFSYEDLNNASAVMCAIDCNRKSQSPIPSIYCQMCFKNEKNLHLYRRKLQKMRNLAQQTEKKIQKYKKTK